MKTIKYTINYGGYVGTDEEYEIEVPDDATEEQIEDAIAEDYEEQIHWNCEWNRVTDDTEEED